MTLTLCHKRNRSSSTASAIRRHSDPQRHGSDSACRLRIVGGMSVIRELLEQRGFAKYVDTFEREEVEFDALPHMMSEILREVVVSASPEPRSSLRSRINSRKPCPRQRSNRLIPRRPWTHVLLDAKPDGARLGSCSAIWCGRWSCRNNYIQKI